MNKQGKLAICEPHNSITNILFYCPGCKDTHMIDNTWNWNGDTEQPTFTPSVLVRSGHYASGDKSTCWCTYNEQHPDNPSRFSCSVCHSFVTDGKIQYLSDCSHDLCGQTVDMVDYK